MNKQKFLYELERSLRGKVDEAELKRQMDYYSSYISNEINAGRTEDDIFSELGDPRLIARTIVQTYIMKDDPIRNRYRNSSTDTDRESSGDYNEGGRFKSRLSICLTVISVVIILLVVISVAFSVIKILIPFLVFALLVIAIIRLVR